MGQEVRSPSSRKRMPRACVVPPPLVLKSATDDHAIRLPTEFVHAGAFRFPRPEHVPHCTKKGNGVPPQQADSISVRFPDHRVEASADIPFQPEDARSLFTPKYGSSPGPNLQPCASKGALASRRVCRKFGSDSGSSCSSGFRKGHSGRRPADRRGRYAVRPRSYGRSIGSTPGASPNAFPTR